MRLNLAIFFALILIVILFIAAYYAPGHGESGPTGLMSKVEWQRMANPGKLSNAHAFLDHKCNACHTPVKGVEAVNCIQCHANNTALLKRQTTSFHANISSCVECHKEHQGKDGQITQMNHNAFVSIGMRQLGKKTVRNQEDKELFELVEHFLEMSQNKNSLFVNPHLSKEELTLQCATCHQNQDVHFSLFGKNCSNCHETSRWNIPEFVHPSPRSMDCAQCHQAPPSHYMRHFKMISQTVARKPHARIDQCFICHQTTSWTDIKGIGTYKHH